MTKSGWFWRCTVAAFALVAAATQVQAQEVLDPNYTLGAPVSVRPLVGPRGFAVDPSNGDIFFITDSGADLAVLHTDGNTEVLADNVGNFSGQLTDMRLGPDDLLYTIGASNEVKRFMKDGTALPVLATLPNGALNAWGLDFDRLGNLYASDRSANIYKVTPAGDVSVFSTGWQDVDEIQAGPDDSFFVLDGSSRVNDRDKVWRVDHNGDMAIYATGMGQIYAGAYDWGTRSFFAGTTTGEIYRVRDANFNGTIEMDEVVLFGQNFGYINTMAFGRSSQDALGVSLFIGNFQTGEIHEIPGFLPRMDWGQRIDDDGDGYCQQGQDMNADGDCLDEGEDNGQVDCEDNNPQLSPGVAEICDGNFIDDDCDGLADDLDPDCGLLSDSDGDGYCTLGQDMNADGDCTDLGEQNGAVDCDDSNPNANPGLVEVCTDGFDNNCDGDIDEADALCTTVVDVDGDGYCPLGQDLNADGDCADADEQNLESDCDEMNADINSAVDEICTDGFDNNCDGVADEADGECGTFVDNDNDGFCEAGQDLNDDGDCADADEQVMPFDCLDNDGQVFPGAGESICTDGIDNDCNGDTDVEDAGCADFVDNDSDGFCEQGQDLNADGDCLDTDEDNGQVDCDDAVTTIFPGAEEICIDGADNNCDGDIDEADGNCGAFVDNDTDGFCEAGQDLNADGDCADADEQVMPFDCLDNDGQVFPGAAEVCNDGIDNDCNGDADAADAACGDFVDNDGDGFCEQGQDLNADGDCLDTDEDNGQVDCDDAQASTYPGAPELCMDGLDNNCDGDVDMDDAICQTQGDGDGDGYCQEGQDLNADGDCTDEGEQNGAVDCDPSNGAIFPGADEVCTDGADNNCDGDSDEADAACGDYVDGDGDGYCAAGQDLNEDGDCTDMNEQGALVDCDPSNATVYPGAPEICDDGLDTDCDGVEDVDEVEDCGGGLDGDGDGYCPMGQDLNADGDCLDADEQNDASDCNDADAEVNPDADEVCTDAQDNDCDGDADEADEACGDYVDGDEDGYCAAGQDLNADGDCADADEQGEDTDCDDANAGAFPGAAEVCTDGVDTDCDGLEDAQEADCGDYVDGDQDGYCVLGQDLNADGDCLDEGEDTEAVDCAPEDGAVYPGAGEVCNDGVDNDCDSLVDDADAQDCGDAVDRDGDGYCGAGSDLNADGDCQDEGEQNGAVDCDDTNAAAYPGAVEICGDGVDSNCDGLVDVMDMACAGLVDVDGDGFCAMGFDYNHDGDCFGDNEISTEAVDCEPMDGAIYPGAAEACNDGVDNNCDGLTDAEDESCGDFLDDDGDGFCEQGVDANEDGDCLDEDEDTDDADCDDSDEDVHPDADERCGDGIDNNCDGDVDTEDYAVCGPLYQDQDGDGYCRQGVDDNGDGFCDRASEQTADVDCNDGDAAVNPGAAEVCGDRIDNNCDGLRDYEDEGTCPIPADRTDQDGDGFCALGRDINNDGDCLDRFEDSGQRDCDDGDADINPQAAEICDDNQDNDCDGLVDDGDTLECSDEQPDPEDTDSDLDGVESAEDNCPFHANEDQVDSDGDGIGDACDPIFDGDVEGSPLGGQQCSAAAPGRPAGGAGGLATLALLGLGALIARRRR